MSTPTSSLLAFTFAALALAACGGNNLPQGEPGTAGAACLDGGGCNDDLVCGSPCFDPGLDPPFTDHSGCVERCLACDDEGNASPACPQPE